MNECDGYVYYDAGLKRSTAVRSDVLSRNIKKGNKKKEEE